MAQNDELYHDLAPPDRTTENFSLQAFNPIGIEMGRKLHKKIPKVAEDKCFEDEQAKRLYKYLWEPIEQYLPETEVAQTYIIPSGNLAFVPFSALIDANGNRLMEKHAITFVPSVTLLQKLYDSYDKCQSTGALVVGNPKMPKLEAFGKPPQLPTAEKEAYNVADILGTVPFCRENATKEVVIEFIKTVRPKMIHIATHGLLRIPNSKSYLLGGLVFATTGRELDSVENCVLLPEEIQQLDLQGCKLVMLTCCNTGQGKVSAEGLLGIGRAFLFAGATTVVLSLWEVPDTHITLQIVNDFYSNYIQLGSAAKSLREAMLKAKQNGVKLHEWASFYVIGMG